MLKPIRGILGVGSIPSHRASAVEWMKRNGVHIHKVCGSGGIRFEVDLFDLPRKERISCLEREVDGGSIDEGQYDDLMHAELAHATPSRRYRAERKAAIAWTLITLREQGVKEADRFAIVQKKFGTEGTSTPSLKRLLKAVRGVDPVNFAPALLDKYTPPTFVSNSIPGAYAHLINSTPLPSYPDNGIGQSTSSSQEAAAICAQLGLSPDALND